MRISSIVSRLGLFAAAGVALALLSACATKSGFTTDDGRAVDEQLLGHIKSYGAGERSLRPAIVRSAALQDRGCDKQWELPFSVASSQSWDERDRVAWVRGLGVDERLTVIAAAPGSPLQLGERIAGVQGNRSDRAEALLEQLAERRDDGKPFQVQTSSGTTQTVQPLQVCRGYARLAPPNTPELQDYHWLLSYHPLQLAQTPLTDDEALWAVLWTQGLSEEGGARMKTFHYGTKIIGTLYNLATLATGLKGAALAADAAIKVAKSAASQVASDLLKQQIVEQARQYAMKVLRDAATDAGDKLLRAQVASSMQQAALNRGALGGVSRVAATVFERADGWAYERMAQLHANPLASVSLHQKLAEGGLAANVFVFDTERMAELSKLAAAQGLEPAMLALLKGIAPQTLAADIGAMPLLSAADEFRYDDGGSGPDKLFAQGLVAALLEMPVTGSGSGKP